MEKQIYNFDITQYKQENYQLISALNPSIYYMGRFLRHDHHADRKTKINTVQFDWPFCSFSIRITQTSTIGFRMKGKGNYFNIFLNGNVIGILKASEKATCCEVAQDLDPSQVYNVTISKRTEPQMRGAMSTFKVCTFYGFIVDADAKLLPYDRPERSIEFIGDSDTCAFGNEGEISSAKNFFNMKGRLENAHNGYAAIVARMFGVGTTLLAWSGKGIHSNTLDWGPTMKTLWKRTLASREGDWDMSQSIPDIVVVNIGGNDLLPPASSETEIIETYTSLLEEVRKFRPEAHIFCVVCDEGCLSSEENAENRRQVSLQLQEIIKVAMSRVKFVDDKLHYAFIKVPGGLEDSDYASMMHYAVSGHVKFAQELAKEIAEKTDWPILQPPDTMPFPPQKKDIIVPSESSHSCVII